MQIEVLSTQGGETLDVGTLRVRVAATPGHTDTHLAYVVTGFGSFCSGPAVEPPIQEFAE